MNGKRNSEKPTYRILIIILAIITAISTVLILMKLNSYDKLLMEQIQTALERITLNWLFIISYVLFLTTSCYLIIGKFKEIFGKTWKVFLFFPLAAGILDTIENFCLLTQLKSIGPTCSLTLYFEIMFALLEFLLIFLTGFAIFSTLLIRKGAKSVKFRKVLDEELEIIKKRREAVNSKDNTGDPKNDLFGIALSGGGIRSATINAGILEILNKAGIFSKADFLSTVSGGGYIGGYVHSKLWREQDQNLPYQSLFKEDDMKHLKNKGEYLTPGEKVKKLLSIIKLCGAIIFSMIMNWTWFISFLLALLFLVQMILVPMSQVIKDAVPFFGIAVALIFAYHFFLHWSRNLKLIFKRKPWSSNVLNTIEGFLLLFILAYLINLVKVPISIAALIGIKGATLPMEFFLTFFILIISSLFYNPNILSMHRFYRDRLSEAYLKTDKKEEKNINLKLAELNSGKTVSNDSQRKWNAPYPLINTCLNLLGESDKEFKCKKLSDYFLLSPLFCGSNRTGYVRTDSPGYNSMTLATAISVSGAAVNPNMGTKTNPLLAFFMSLLNLKLGYWALNPKRAVHHFRHTIWPYYLLTELFSKTNTSRLKVNISDGGHIENLSVYELLRRRCRLIIAVDAGADPGFDFNDLKNLVIRARNELHIDIKFRQEPETAIKPKPSKGYSDYHFVVADLEKLPKKGEKAKHRGVLIYIKSSLKAPLTKKDFLKSKSNSYNYKTYHPNFPHESTGDQYFDEAQWEAYYNLGRYIAGDVLRVDDVTDEMLLNQKKNEFEQMTIDQLIKNLVPEQKITYC